MSKTIEEIRLENGRTLAKLAGGTAGFAAALGMSSSQAGQIIGRAPKRNIGTPMARRIEAAFEKPRGWLDEDHQEPPLIVEQPRAEYQVQPQKSRSPLIVPVFESPASMGRGHSQPEIDVIVGGIPLDMDWIRRSMGTITSPYNLQVIPAYGDSMYDTFSDGDLLFVDTGVKEVRIDAVYVLALNDELFVRRLQRRPDGSILMISDNKSYEAYKIENGERERFTVLGRVVRAWVGKKL